MINVILGTNTDHSRVPIDENKTLREILESNGIDYTVGTLHMDGASLRPGDLDRTFADFGVTNTCSLIAVQKADCAN